MSEEAQSTKPQDGDAGASPTTPQASTPPAVPPTAQPIPQAPEAAPIQPMSQPMTPSWPGFQQQTGFQQQPPHWAVVPFTDPYTGTVGNMSIPAQAMSPTTTAQRSQQDTPQQAAEPHSDATEARESRLARIPAKERPWVTEALEGAAEVELLRRQQQAALSRLRDLSRVQPAFLEAFTQVQQSTPEGRETAARVIAQQMVGMMRETPTMEPEVVTPEGAVLRGHEAVRYSLQKVRVDPRYSFLFAAAVPTAENLPVGTPGTRKPTEEEIREEMIRLRRSLR